MSPLEVEHYPLAVTDPCLIGVHASKLGKFVPADGDAVFHAELDYVTAKRNLSDPLAKVVAEFNMRVRRVIEHEFPVWSPVFIHREILWLIRELAVVEKGSRMTPGMVKAGARDSF